MRSCLLLSVALSALFTGCFLRRSAADIERLDQLGAVRGRVEPIAGADAPVVLTLLARDPADDSYTVHASQVRYGAGTFEFLCRPGEYFLFAYEDRNQDMAFQADENIGWHQRELLEVAAGDVIDELTVRLRLPEEGRRTLPRLYDPAEPLPPVDLSKDRLGVVKSIDDPVFSQEVGTRGLWEPVRYLEEGHNGVYFLEPYDPAKVPVLFVHGIKGCGDQFRTLIEGLDRERYQPWIVQYASGLRLEMVAERLAQSLVLLRLKHGFDRLHLVAHSMGGLVSRATLNALHREDHEFVDLFVSYSTPFGGHAAARSGVDWSPVILPAWYDMVPESPFLETLYEQPLPSRLPHWMAFSYRGEPSMFVDEQNDGVVTLKSQLHPAAQRAVRRLRGFDEDHATILTCAASQEFLAKAFASVDDR